MVLIESKKYACETCIKGHRSSGCKHTDRPLYEIKKKGRPITQCSHCRELRAKKQVHVKCTCNEETIAESETTPACSSTSKKGVSKMLESAAFPNGLPEALEASVAVQHLKVASDSDHESCSCPTGEECHCCTPRKAVHRARKKAAVSTPDLTAPNTSTSTSPLPSESPNTSNNVNAANRISELRPLLPKPAHDPSSTLAHSLTRHHPHEKLYSPYGRAYDYIHPNHPIHHNTYPSQVAYRPSSRALSSTSSLAVDDTRSPHMTYPAFDAADVEAWNSFQMAGPTDNVLASLCGCGDGCACPRCFIHKPNADRAGLDASTCAEPDACRGCLDCAPSFSYREVPDTALPISGNPFSLSESDDSNAIDEWIQRLQTSVPSFQPLPASEFESRSRSGSPIGMGSNSSDHVTLPADTLNYQDPPSEMPLLYSNGEQNTYIGRSRSFDDILSTFDTNVPLDLSLYNSQGDGTQGYVSNFQFDFRATSSPTGDLEGLKFDPWSLLFFDISSACTFQMHFLLVRFHRRS
ncbi:hypothetical protein BDP27DRAFT_897645 [Rhodocollybia butyracea]|uniref:Copper-fist domain-containing protein n=1 Tax=Rhodocollybia butyracea TaxID=206335 RepID=A0A9P5Q0Z0_9AGAR|nr:hypothetical protein BDP27DRAFT_897645 [Rhodocollybia butyracea]